MPPQPLVDHSNPDLTAMAFGELPRLQDISCLSRTVQAFPDTRHGSLTASASYEFENRSGQSRKAAFGLNPGLPGFLRVGQRGFDSIFRGGLSGIQ